MLLRGEGGRDVKAVLAIVGNREFAVEAPTVSRRLVLNFDDADVPDMSGDPVRALKAVSQQKWSTEIGRPQSPPTIEHARAIIEFANAVRELDGTLLCHCLAGVSRSTAAALLCLATWTGAGHEPYCVEQLLQVRPSARPHRDLLHWGDELLGRGGKLLGALPARSTRAEG
jgi:predicted protein tyrosine phosphatase